MTAEPTTSDQVHHVVRMAGKAGMTWAEVEATFPRGDTGIHHGSISGALSRLETEGVLARLAEKRAGNHVYVAKDVVFGRPLATKRSRPVDDFLEYMLTSYDADGHCRALHGEPGSLGPQPWAHYDFICRLRDLTGHNEGPFSKVKADA